MKQLATLVLCALMLQVATKSFAQGAQQFLLQGGAKPLVIQETAKDPSGNPTTLTTNWTDAYITATGRCYLGGNNLDPDQNRYLCEEGAKVMARRNLLAMVEKVKIIDTITLRNAAFEQQVTYQILEGFIKGAEVVGTFTYTDNYVEVTMRMEMYKGTNSVATTVVNAASQSSGKPGVVKSFLEENQVAAVEPDPALRKQVLAELESMGYTKDASGKIPAYLNVTTPNGTPVQPSLFPTINVVDENGRTQSVNMANYFPNMTMGDAPKYLAMTQDILKTLDLGKKSPVIDMVQNYDGTFTLDLRKQPKKKFGEVMKKIGSGLLSVLSVAAVLL